MNDFAVVLPVKTLSKTKQRLADSLDGRTRRALIESSLTDTLKALEQARSVGRVILVTSDPKVSRVAHKFGHEVVADTSAESHSEAALLGIEYLNRSPTTPRAVLLLPADCPLVSSSEIDRLVTGHPVPYVSIVPDRHGTGTNALVLAPPNVITPAFGEGSCERHQALARAAGVPFSVEPLPGLGLDLDTPADLIAFATAFESSDGNRGRRTAKVLGI